MENNNKGGKPFEDFEKLMKDLEREIPKNQKEIKESVIKLNKGE